MPTTPIQYSYWVVPGQLLAGEYPRNIDDASSPGKIKALLDAGITAFIDLTHEDDDLSSYQDWIGNVAYYKLPIRDFSIPDTEEFTRNILNTIDCCIDKGQMVYVHCWGGSGRTGLIVGCWLVRHGLPGKAALAKLKELWQQNPKSKRKCSPDNSHQEQYIVNWRST